MKTKLVNKIKEKIQTIRKNRQSYKFYFIVTFVFIILLSITFVTLYQNKPTALAKPSQDEQLISLVNNERQKQGLNKLIPNDKLYYAAYNKAKDMLSDDYFEHYSPDGQSPWDFIHQTGYQYLMAGENLAIDFRTIEGAHKALMASQTHKDNILKSQYQEIGIASVMGDFAGRQTTITVEIFATPISTNKTINNWFDKLFAK